MLSSLACFPELYKLQRSSDLAPLFLRHLPGPGTGQLIFAPDKFISQTPALGPVPGCHRCCRFHAAAQSWSQAGILALASVHDGLSQITSPFYDVSESMENRDPSATVLRPPGSAIHAAAVCGPLLTTEDGHPPGPGEGQRTLTHLVSVAESPVADGETGVLGALLRVPEAASLQRGRRSRLRVAVAGWIHHWRKFAQDTAPLRMPILQKKN